MQQKSIAPMVHRQQTVDSLKKFNARRKLKVCQLLFTYTSVVR